MKIHIAYKFTSGAWGGGNQFLLLLKKEFEKLGLIAGAKDADIILFI